MRVSDSGVGGGKFKLGQAAGQLTSMALAPLHQVALLGHDDGLIKISY